MNARREQNWVSYTVAMLLERAARDIDPEISHRVLTHKFLLRELWDDLTDAQYLRVYVRQLRQKIEANPERPQYILTETGIGYRLRAPS
jgi:hypothetical protein